MVIHRSSRIQWRNTISYGSLLSIIPLWCYHGNAIAMRAFILPQLLDEFSLPEIAARTSEVRRS